MKMSMGAAVIVIMVLRSISSSRRPILRLVAGIVLIATACSCQSLTAGTSRKVSVTVSLAQVNVGGSAAYTVTLSPVNTKGSTTVNYSMSGTAARGQDYSLTGTYGKVVIPKRSGSAMVTLNGPPVATSSGTKTATMNLASGSGYILSTTPTASILVLTDGSAPTPTPTPTPPASPTPTPSPSATPTPTPTGTPTATLTSSGTQVEIGYCVTLAVTLSHSATTATTINYSMSGNAVLARDYSLLGPANQITIPAGAVTGIVQIRALTDMSTGLKTATMTLQMGTGYRASTPNQASVLIGPPNNIPSVQAGQEIWIAVRTDGQRGSGTQMDPYDGSRQDKFDSLMWYLQWTPNLTINLGPGVFRTSVGKYWTIAPGWLLRGAGMYNTTVQLAGSATGVRYIACLTSDPNVSSDNVTVRDLTCDANWDELFLTADTGAAGEKNMKTVGIVIWGNNGLLDQVRSINTYGSWANGLEQFAISLAGSRFGDGTGNVIQSCRAEQPRGNYGAPYAMGGWPPYSLTNSKIISSTAVGINDGANHGFTTGGVNSAYLKDCQIDGNTFIDCMGAYYQDTGSCDGVKVTNNTVVRGMMGAAFRASVGSKRNIEISGNNFQIQNRYIGGGVYGIFVDQATATNLTITNNSITFDASGPGMLQFWGITANPVTNATISNNIVEPSINTLSGTGITLFGNRHPDGTLIPGLGN